MTPVNQTAASAAQPTCEPRDVFEPMHRRHATRASGPRHPADEREWVDSSHAHHPHIRCPVLAAV